MKILLEKKIKIMFKTKEDQKIFKEYVKNGYLIFDIKDLKNLIYLKKTVKFIKKNLKSKYQKITLKTIF